MKYQVIIIGGGPAGYTAAETAGKGGLSILLIEFSSGCYVGQRRFRRFPH